MVIKITSKIISRHIDKPLAVYHNSRRSNATRELVKYAHMENTSRALDKSKHTILHHLCDIAAGKKRKKRVKRIRRRNINQVCAHHAIIGGKSDAGRVR